MRASMDADSWWSPFSQVIEQCRDCSGEKNQGCPQKPGKRPVEPRHRGRPLIQTLEHFWPKIAAEFRVPLWRDGVLKNFADFFFVLVSHLVAPVFSLHRIRFPWM